MLWLPIVYGLCVAALVTAFFYFAAAREQRGALPWVAGVCAFALVAGVSGFNVWVVETKPNYGVPE